MAWKNTLVACVLAIALGNLARAQDLKLGVLTDLGGPYADSSGLGAVEATKMAVEDLKPQLGSRTVEVVSTDHQSKADIGAAIVAHWLDTEGVDAIVNVPNSAIALAVQTVTRERKKIFLITGGVRQLTDHALGSAIGRGYARFQIAALMTSGVVKGRAA